MGLFSKEKKYTPDEIFDLINTLPKEEKEALKAKFDDLYKAEDEREIDKIEEEKTDDTETSDEKADEVKEESEEIGKDVEEIEKTGTEEEKAETAEGSNTDEAEQDATEKDNTAEIIKALTDKVNSLESAVSELIELKQAMTEYVGKQKESFGYSGDATEKRKTYDEMSSEELKRSILYN